MPEPEIVLTPCTCLYAPDVEGYWEDPDCPTHAA